MNCLYHIYIIKLLCEDFLTKLVTIIKLNIFMLFYPIKIIFYLFLAVDYGKIYSYSFTEKGEPI